MSSYIIHPDDEEIMKYATPKFKYENPYDEDQDKKLHDNYRGSIGVEKGWGKDTFYELLRSDGGYPEAYIIGELTSLDGNFKKKNGTIITKEVTPQAFEKMHREFDQMTRPTKGGKKRKSRKQKKSLKRKSSKARKSHKKRR